MIVWLIFRIFRFIFCPTYLYLPSLLTLPHGINEVRSTKWEFSTKYKMKFAFVIRSEKSYLLNENSYQKSKDFDHFYSLARSVNSTRILVLYQVISTSKTRLSFILKKIMLMKVG